MDKPGLIPLPSVRAELVRTGGLSWVPPRAGIALPVMRPAMVQPALDTEFTRYATSEAVSLSPLTDIVAMAGTTIAEVFYSERYKELVD